MGKIFKLALGALVAYAGSFCVTFLVLDIDPETLFVWNIPTVLIVPIYMMAWQKLREKR